MTQMVMGWETLKGFPNIFQEGSPEVIIVAAKTVSDNTQLYLNNIGCILGSISQTEGYTQETLSSGSMGDPYITTMDGTLYKLPNLHKTYRLLQTSDIIINADVRPLPSSLQEKRKEFVRTHRITDNTHDTEYFMSDVFIQFKGKFILQYDMNMKIKVNTLSSSPDAKVFRSNIRKFFSCKVRGNGWYNPGKTEGKTSTGRVDICKKEWRSVKRAKIDKFGWKIEKKLIILN